MQAQNARNINSRMSELSLREAESVPMDNSILPRNIEKSDGVPVMKVGLNNPHTKSIVMLKTDFSAEDLNEQPVLPKTKRTTKKKRRNGASKPP